MSCLLGLVQENQQSLLLLALCAENSLYEWLICNKGTVWIDISWKVISMFLTLLVLTWNILAELGQYHQLLMPRFLVLPGHQQPQYWLCMMSWSLSFMKNDFYHLYYQRVEKWLKMQIYFYVPTKQFIVQGVKFIGVILNGEFINIGLFLHSL